MKRLIVTIALALLSLATPSFAAIKPKPDPSLQHLDHIFVGWVDLDVDAYAFVDCDKKEWATLIDTVNAYFIGELKSEALPGKMIKAAKGKEDTNADGTDLYIKFTNVSVNKGKHIQLAIHFIDPKTGNELASLPFTEYGGGKLGLERCLDKSFNTIAEALKEELGS